MFPVPSAVHFCASYSCVQVGVNHVLCFHLTSQTHASRWICYSEVLLGVNVCLHDVLWCILASYPEFFPLYTQFSRDVHQSSRSNTIMTLKVKSLQMMNHENDAVVHSIWPFIQHSWLSLWSFYNWSGLISGQCQPLLWLYFLTCVAFDKMICQMNKRKCQGLWPNKKKVLGVQKVTKV